MSGSHDMVEHSGCPSTHWHEVHESVSHLSPSLRWTPSTVHPAGTERTVGGGGHCGQHCPSGVYWSSGPHHNSGHELHGLTSAVVSGRGNGRVAQLHVNDRSVACLLTQWVKCVCKQTRRQYSLRQYALEPLATQVRPESHWSGTWMLQRWPSERQWAQCSRASSSRPPETSSVVAEDAEDIFPCSLSSLSV